MDYVIIVVIQIHCIKKYFHKENTYIEYTQREVRRASKHVTIKKSTKGGKGGKITRHTENNKMVVGLSILSNYLKSK
jgi:hypothetical protein